MKRRPYSFQSSMSTAPDAAGGGTGIPSRTASAKKAGIRKMTSRTASNLERGGAQQSSDDRDSKSNSSGHGGGGGEIPPTACGDSEDWGDRYNYALLIALYTVQGIPMGLSASVPFLIQQKVKLLASRAGAAAAAGATASAAAAEAASVAGSHQNLARLQYDAQAIFALCSWPFSLKLLWAPIVDAVYLKRFGRRKSWLVPVQALAGAVMVLGSGYVERQLGLGPGLIAGAAGAAAAAAGANGVDSNAENMVKEAMDKIAPAAGNDASKTGRNLAAAATAATDSVTFDVKGVTAFFFLLYFLMATQDVAVDGWALTMLSKRNRGKGPLCNSIGQNLGYFLSFVGFLALNDAETSENLWRPLFGLPSKPGEGLVSLGGFVRFTGAVMLILTTFVAIFKKEVKDPPPEEKKSGFHKIISIPFLGPSKGGDEIDQDDDDELDASQIGLAETYKRLWAVCKLPAVRHLFLVLLTYRLPTALSDNVKFLKAVEFGLSKQTTALLSPLLVLPLGIVVPIAASRIWRGRPLTQFMDAYKVRVTLVALFDVAMLVSIRNLKGRSDWGSSLVFWSTIVGSTALQAIVHSLQFNSQMTFFAHRVDPAIGGAYMTLLNTAANLGGTWPASFIMYCVGRFTLPPVCATDPKTGNEVCTGGRDAYFPLQAGLSLLGILWIAIMGVRVRTLAELPDDAWRTHIGEEEIEPLEVDMGSGENKDNNEGKNKDRKQA